MKFFIFLILAIIILFIYKKSMAKIDADERKALSTPGIAQYIRDNFPEIVNYMSLASGFQKEFERNDLIRFSNPATGQIVLLQQLSSQLKLAVIKNNSVLKEWDIRKGDTSSLLLSELERAIGSRSSSVNENATTNQFKSSISKPNIARVADMIDFGLKWREKLLEECFTYPSSAVRAEALMYTCWRAWYYCLEQEKVSRDQSYAYDFFAHLMAYLEDDYPRFSETQYFMPLFQNRYKIYQTDLIGLSTSNYPITKQYLPINTYKAFCTDSLSIIEPLTSTASSLSMRQMDEMTEFVGKFIKVTNAMSLDLIHTF